MTLTLTPVYLVMAVSGVGLLAFMTLFDEIADVLDDAFDAVFDIDVDDVGTRWISGYSLIAFVGFFGVGGAFAKYLGISDRPSVIAALFFGFCGGGAAALFMSWMKRQGRSTHVESGSLAGKPAQVTIPIPERGVGEVSVVQDEVHRFAAQSSDGVAIPRGAEVIIDKEGSVLTVRRKR